MKKSILILILVLLGALLAFHFYAANQAEKQIDAAIQAQADSSGGAYSIQYSSIEVSPFSGDIHLKDLNIIRGSTIERAKDMLVDLRYIDFLNIYIGGIEYGLKQLSSADIDLDNVSYVNRETLQEFSCNTLNVFYQGNMWDGIQSMVQNRPAIYDHKMHLSAFKNHYTKPEATLGDFTADAAYADFEIPEGSATWGQAGHNNINFKNIIWTPPSSFQKKFGFFIQGFGYPLDALPVKEMGLSYNFTKNSRLKITNGIVATDLFTASFEGAVTTDSTWADASFNPLNITVSDLSKQFKNVLINMEQLFDFKLPSKENGIHFQLVGPVLKPRISHKK